jgi:hypothetical protein
MLQYFLEWLSLRDFCLFASLRWVSSRFSIGSQFADAAHLQWGARRRSINRGLVPNPRRSIEEMQTRTLVFLPMSLLFSVSVLAHTPQFSCFDEGGGKVICEGGFSDGSSASGADVSVLDGSGKVVLKGKMDANSEFRFTKPKTNYKVMFDAGPGHSVEVLGKDIVE